LHPPAHRLRALAFAADLSLLLIFGLLALALGRLTGRLGVAAVALLLLWLTYLSVSIWLTDGQTGGKAGCALQVRRSDGGAIAQSPRGLVWALGRHSLGYVVVDVFGLGTLLALATRRRRCLHDLAFGSIVVQTENVVVPKEFRPRFEAFCERFDTAYEDAKERNAALVAVWKYLSKGLALVLTVLAPFILSAASSGATEVVCPPDPATPVGALASFQTAGVWVGTGVATSVVAVVALTPQEELLNVEGTWVLTDTQMTVEGVFDPPYLDGEVLLIELRGGELRITQGPHPLVDTTFEPRRRGEAGVVATSEVSSRSNCVNEVTRQVIVPDIYAVSERWEFLTVGASATGSDDVERFDFRYLRRGVKDGDGDGAEACPDTTLVEITATAVRYGPLD
jgi:uncharacterized RDD family membrane protein YckC